MEEEKKPIYALAGAIWQMPFVGLFAYWLLKQPEPGLAVTILGLAAVIMAVRANRFTRTEEVIWIVVAVALCLIEIRSIRYDRAKQEREMVDARTREEIARTDANKSFGLLVAEDRALFQSMKHVNALAEQSLENITGGRSYAIVTPQVWEGKVPISLSIRNAGKRTLTGVTVRIYGAETWKTERGFYEAPTINVGTLHAGEMKLLKETITPTDSGFRDGALKADQFQIHISAQNFTVVEYLFFREGTRIPWTFSYKVTRQFVKSRHGQTTYFGYETMADQKEWLGEK